MIRIGILLWTSCYHILDEWVTFSVETRAKKTWEWCWEQDNSNIFPREIFL